MQTFCLSKLRSRHIARDCPQGSENGIPAIGGVPIPDMVLVIVTAVKSRATVTTGRCSIRINAGIGLVRFYSEAIESTICSTDRSDKASAVGDSIRRTVTYCGARCILVS